MSDARNINPLIMTADRTLMADGRYLIYYSFEKSLETEAASETRGDKPESTDEGPTAE